MMRETSDMIQAKINQLRTELAVDFIGVALASENPTNYKKEIRWRYVSGNIGERYKKIVLQVGHGLAGIVWRTGRYLLENDLSEKTAEELLEYPIAIMEKLQSVIVVPLLDTGVIIGVLLIGYRDSHQITDALISELTVVATKTASILSSIEDGGHS